MTRLATYPIRNLSNAKLHDALRELRNAVEKLYGTNDRPRARKNARREMLNKLATLRLKIDEDYPAIVERKAPRPRRTPKERMRALVREGWREVVHGQAAFASCGVPIKRVAWNERHEEQPASTYVSGKGWVKPPPVVTVIPYAMFFIPGWAYAIGPDKPAELKAAKKSNTRKRAALAAASL